jgi:hypothetical protein
MSTRNVTVSLEEEIALWARLEAARRDTSVSRLLGDVLKHTARLRSGATASRLRPGWSPKPRPFASAG